MMKKIFLLLSFLCMHAQVTAADGDLDPTFGAGAGFVDNPAGRQAVAVEIQTDDKLVVVGFDAVFNAQLVRYNTDGTLDLSFNGTGIGEQAIFADVTCLLILPDGKIIVGGSDFTGNFFQLVRYNPNGTIDTSFGTLGYATGPDGRATAIILQTDSQIVATGIDNTTGSVRTVRFAADGNSSFTFSTVGGPAPLSIGQDIVIQTDGKIIVGYELIFTPSFFLLRYNPDGTIDTTYGTGGTATGPTGNITGLVIQPNDFVIAGGAPSPSGSFQIARFDTTGTLDATFGTTGPGFTVGPDGFARDIVLQANGYSVLIGHDDLGNFQLVRYTDTGAIDTANFGTLGIVTAPGGDAYGGALQQDGKIIAVGQNNPFPTVGTFFRVARYENSPILTDTQILVPTNGATLPAGTIEFSGAAQNPANIYILVDGVVAGSTITDPSPTNTWTLSITITTPGTHTIEVVAIYNDGNVNISDTITITIESLTPINPTGTMACNKFLNTKECVLTITWTPSAATDVVAYRIFRDGIQIAEIPATAPNTYTLCAATKFCTDCCTLSDFKNLTIASVNSDGDVSDAVSISTPCSPAPQPLVV